MLTGLPICVVRTLDWAARSLCRAVIFAKYHDIIYTLADKNPINTPINK